MRIVAALLLLANAAIAAESPRELDWLEMMPKDEVDALTSQTAVEHSGMFKAEQTGSFRVIEDLDDQHVKIAGYIVPVEVDGENQMSEFFIVPYFGACIHVPPPPPNQIILARLKKPIPVTDIYDAFWIEGTLNVETIHNDIASAAYTMDVEGVKLWE
jgi:hypothetical protein